MKKENIATHLSALFLIVFFITIAIIRHNHNEEIVPKLLSMTIITILSWIIITQKKCCQE
jgi:hypothetical protein